MKEGYIFLSTYNPTVQDPRIVCHYSAVGMIAYSLHFLFKKS
jgi:hypothetical protein